MIIKKKQLFITTFFIAFSVALNLLVLSEKILAETYRVSDSSADIQGNDYCHDPYISADDRFVA